MSKSSVCLKIPKNQGERAISIAIKMDLLDKSLVIKRDENNLYIPLLHEIQGNLWKFKEKIDNSEIMTTTFTKKESVKTYIQILEDRLPSHLIASLPQAFDIIGDIVIIEIPPELKTHQTLIGEAILRVHKNIKTVLAKAGYVSGIFRVRKYAFLAGENKTLTSHREFGCLYHVDLSKVYFSPRLSEEHQRVASLVQEQEVIVDFFAGAGPFSVLIGKRKPKVRVYAVDLNPDAIELLKINIRTNRVEKQVFPVLANAKDIAQTELKGVADRVIMNLPETAIEYISSACDIIKLEGGIMHFYAFIRTPDTIENLKQILTDEVEKNNRKVTSFLDSRRIRETAPYESQVVLDVKIV